MSNKTPIPHITMQINERFFQCVDDLCNRRIIRGLGTLAKQWDVSRFILTWSKHHPQETSIKIEYIYYLVRDYDVSLDWIFFGKGPMYKL